MLMGGVGSVDQEFSLLSGESQNVYGQVGPALHPGDSETSWGAR